jgi:L-galactose dehydrogenase
MLYRTLGSTDLRVSQLGFGASPLGDVFGTTDPGEGIQAVHRAIDAGINFFDVAPYYGQTLAEERLGASLLGVRKNVVLATKCGRYGADSFDFSASRIKRSIDESLRRLRTDYVDLFQAHDVEFGDADQIVEETIPALREVQKSGKARYIGITGYPLRMLMSCAQRARVDTILSYCRYNLLIADLNHVLVPFAEANAVGLINASPLHMGLLAGSDIPVWHPAPPNVREAAAGIIELCRKDHVDPVIVSLAFSIRHPYISSTLVGMSTREQVNTNLKALTFEISPALAAKIQAVAARVMNVVWPSGRDENADAAASYETQE